MSPSLILLLFRLAGAALLLAFLGLIFRFLYQDMKLARLATPGAAIGLGALRVLENNRPAPPVDSILELAPVTTIGRNNRNSIVLHDSYVSGEHALLTWRDSQWWLEDLDSRNGTLLNDVALEAPVVISAGDVITIGGARFRLEIPGKLELIAESGESQSVD